MNKKVNLTKRHLNYLPKALAFVFIVNLLSCSVFATKTCKYLIPKNYNGWVRVYTGIEGAEKIPISADGLIYTFKVPADGKLITSTPFNSDAYIEFYFDDGKQPVRIQGFADERKNLIHDSGSGSYDIPCVFVDEKVDNNCKGLKYSYTMFYVGTFEQYQEEDKKIKHYFEFLKKNIYKDLKGYVQPLEP